MLFKPRAKKAIPASATRSTKDGKAYATWVNRAGKKTTAEIKVDAAGSEFIYIETSLWWARYTDSAGRRMTKNTKCTDRTAAAGVLAKWKGTTQRVLAGYIPAADEHADRRKVNTVDSVLNEYEAALTQAGRTTKHIGYVKWVMTALKNQAGVTRVIDLSRRHIEVYLAGLQTAGQGARTRNMHKALINGFCVFAVRHGYIESNPAANIEGANQATDRRRIRRALTDEQITKLLDAAERRPLANFMEKNLGVVKNAKPATTRKYQQQGRERRLMYETLLTTAARWSELRAVTVSDCVLDGPAPHIVLKATATKNRRADTVPLTVDLAKRLKAWVKESARIGKAPLFDMGQSGLKAFYLDIAYAEIPKKTDEGIIDIHCLRHTAATRLARAGVPVATAQRILRHSDPKLTMSLYTHLGILDTTAAVESLPALGTAKTKKKTAKK